MWRCDHCNATGLPRSSERQWASQHAAPEGTALQEHDAGVQLLMQVPLDSGREGLCSHVLKDPYNSESVAVGTHMPHSLGAGSTRLTLLGETDIARILCMLHLAQTWQVDMLQDCCNK